MTDQLMISDAELKEIAAGWPAEFRVYPGSESGTADVRKKRPVWHFVKTES